MAHFSCPPNISAKGVPPAVDGVLEEFRRAGYEMQKIIFY